MDDDWDTFGTPADAPKAEKTDAAGEDPFGAGDALDGFGESEAAPAPAAPADDGLFGDDFGDAPVTAPAAQEEEVEEVDMGMFDAPAPAAVPVAMMSEPASGSTPMAPPEEQEDNSALDKWEEEHYQLIKQRREESQQKKEAQKLEATKMINDFEESRKKTISTNKDSNKKAEAEFISSRDNALKAGLSGKDSWEKVSSYLDLTSDPKRNNTVSRMKSVLIAVKSAPPATTKNFGAK
eukprot:CAMPEP_0181310568 /NCGR_PEP_ID=MMETSP1101-20121128/12656_1 /TAXON_ID=46948 /ORGANISM="Rhodomonas abbreviata, Strain Caron Lab Isolate" /LENGTH=236 /DNA_ID=CAMNT_0023417207 /DNA_START=17 /DNA_END=727 /DNA_ORIENTATION=+